MKFAVTMFLVSVAFLSTHIYFGQLFPAIIWGVGTIIWAVNIWLTHCNNKLIEKISAALKDDSN